MDNDRLYTKKPIFKRWWYIVLFSVFILCSFVYSINPVIFMFLTIVDCLLAFPILKNVYTNRKRKNKSASAFDVALLFAIIAIYIFVAAISTAAASTANDHYVGADNTGITYLMLSACAILISIACAIGGVIGAVSRNRKKHTTSTNTYTAAWDAANKQPPIIPGKVEEPAITIQHTTDQPSKNHIQISGEQSDLDMIRKMELDFQKNYKTAFTRLYNRDDCRRTFDALKKKYSDPALPLAVHIRYDQLCEEYAPKFASPNPMASVDHMDGHSFEQYCATVLQKNGFTGVYVTPSSGDHGVDVIAEKEGVRYAIQCKCYSSALGNTPVQEVCAGKSMYNCHVGVVMANNYFTAGAKQLAEKNGILLWDRDKLQQMINSATSDYSRT